MKTCGIYKITNTVNKKIYIGSSKSIRTRVNRHKWELSNGFHNNLKLQNAWNKYGEDAFIFEVIKECKETRLLDEEQLEIDKVWGKDGRSIYNIAKNTLAPMTGIESPMKGKKHSKETCLKMSESHKGKVSPNKGNVYSQDIKDKMSKDRKGAGAGEKNAMAILTWEQVETIREMHKEGKHSLSQLGKELDINVSTIKNIVYNKRWII